MLCNSFTVGDQVRHVQSGWAGDVTKIEGAQVTVHPTHPRPKEVWDKAQDAFVPTPADWPGWTPITVRADELEKR